MALLKSAKFWSALVLAASIGCLLAVFYPILSVQYGAMNFRDASGLLRLIIQVGAGIAVVSVLAFIYSLIRGATLARAMSAIASGLMIGLVLLAVTSQPSEYDSPPGAPLNDISTDTLDPPLYSAVIPLRPEGSNTLVYPGESAVARQAEAFPDIEPILSPLSTTAAFQRSLQIVDEMDWELVAEDSGSGLIEAIATTSFFGFKDDVIIRVRANGSGSVVDIRSHSRLGRGDQGKNAKRIRAFIAQF